MNLTNKTFTDHQQRQLIPILWLFLSFLVLTACLGGGDGEGAATTGADTLLAPGTQGTLVCNATCSQWGQCGSRVDGGGDVVLAGSGGPLVVSHELIFAASTPVQVEGQVTRSLQPATAGDPFDLNFYYVVATDGNEKGGWVAGWCVQATAAP